MKKISLFVFLVSSIAFAQDYGYLSGGFESNFKWYNDDPETGAFFDEENPGSDEHVRSNNYLKLDYTYKNWSAGVQLESYLPMPLLNYSPKYDDTGLSTFYAEYRSEKLKITAGYFYEQFGSGLILRAWEDRQLGINNALRGGRIVYRPTNNIMLTGLYGQQKEGFDVSEGHIFGFDTEIDMADIAKFKKFSLGLGASYVGRYQEADIEKPNFEELTNAFSGRLDFSKNSFYAAAEYVYKIEDAIVVRHQVNNNLVKPGNALLFNFGYAAQGLGINATLRRLENMDFFSDREAAGNDFNMNIVNYLPALTKQHDYLLTNIYVYQAQPRVYLGSNVLKAGEIGGQFDVYYRFKEGSSLGGKYGAKIALNASYWANLGGEYDYLNQDYSAEFFGFGEKYFSDINVEVRKQLSKNWKTIFTYVNQYYNKRYIEETHDIIKTNIGVAEVNHTLNEKQSLRLVAQHLWGKGDDGAANYTTNWAGATLEFNVNQQLSFYVSDIYNYTNDNPHPDVDTENIHYYNVGGSFTKGPHRLSLNYGRQRGGVVCVGGVCRYVPPSTGLSVNLSIVF
ncbi:MAG TPA: DUF6029 family protein [Flavobacteriaceae bacterium]|nr:DUF6029 family protein [Flavobacteriaceae bacterium]